MKLLKVLFVAAVVVAIAAPSFAAVQNIKVSGSIQERAIYMDNFDLRHTTEESTNPRFPGLVPTAAGSGQSINEDSSGFILSNVRVGIDSDLTDNVSASVVLSNQSRWGQLLPGAAVTNNFTSISVNKAYATLKEFFYQPLTLRIGRQDLMFGQGFIIGPGIFRDPNGAFPRPRTDTRVDPFNTANVQTATPVSGPMGLQYSDSTYYDAIRATLDLEPWTIDAIYAKITTSAMDIVEHTNRDHDLAGVNVGYKFDVYNAKAEGYYFFKDDKNFNSDLGYINPVDYAALAGAATGGADSAFLDNSVPGAGARQYDRNYVHVIGLRGDIVPVENLSLSGEGAYQWGKILDRRGAWDASTNGGGLDRKRSAWALDLGGKYLWKDVTYKPNFGLGYTFLSGNKQSNSGTFRGWDPMFKGKFNSFIRDFQYGTGTAYNAIGGNIYRTLDYRAPSGSTNSHTLWVDGGLQPMDDLSLKAKYLHFWAANSAVGRSSRDIGNEVDTSLVYDYTEDVQFDLTGGWFLPGSLFKNNPDIYTKGKDMATIVTGSVKVTF